MVERKVDMNSEKKLETLVALKNFHRAYHDLEALFDENTMSQPMNPYYPNIPSTIIDDWVSQAIYLINATESIEKIDSRKQRLFAHYQVTIAFESPIYTFAYEGTDIYNPFLDVSSRFNVVPEIYYGEAYLESDWCKKQFDLTRDQMIKLILDNERDNAIDNFEHVYLNGMRGYNSYSNDELHDVLYELLDIYEVPCLYHREYGHCPVIDKRDVQGSYSIVDYYEGHKIIEVLTGYSKKSFFALKGDVCDEC